MKYFLLGAFCLLSTNSHALEYEIQLENEQVRVSHVKVMAGEEVGLHRDEFPRVVVGLQGGTITRFEKDGSIREVVFPTDAAVFHPADPIDELHTSKNATTEPVELIVIELKK